MSGTIVLRGVQVELDSDLGRAFITDATRAGESVIDDSTLMEKYDLSLEELQAIANTKAVGRAIRNEARLPGPPPHAQTRLWLRAGQ